MNFLVTVFSLLVLFSCSIASKKSTELSFDLVNKDRTPSSRLKYYLYELRGPSLIIKKNDDIYFYNVELEVPDFVNFKELEKSEVQFAIRSRIREMISLRGEEYIGTNIKGKIEYGDILFHARYVKGAAEEKHDKTQLLKDLCLQNIKRKHRGDTGSCRVVGKHNGFKFNPVKSFSFNGYTISIIVQKDSWGISLNEPAHPGLFIDVLDNLPDYLEDLE